MKMSLRATLAAALAGAIALPALAADLPVRVDAPAPAPIAFDSYHPWMVRVRAIGVLPVSSATVFAAGAPVAGGSLKVSNSVVPEVDISYFFTKNIAVEAICCFTPHKITGAGTLAGVGKVGSVWVFPPTVLLQYHFTNFGAFKPYVGLGVNYTHYFKDSTGPAFAGLKVRDSWGVAAQIGFDYMLTDNWGINFDVKKVMMQPNASTTLLPAVPVTAKVKIDPWIVGVGLTYRFGGGGPVIAKY
jgi:outer membrane protein